MKSLATTILFLCTLLCSAQTDQTITFDALPVKTLGDANFTILATASSALPVTFSSTNTGVATVSGNMVTITGIGITMIKASQAGNGGFNPAPDVSQMLTIKNVTQTPAEQGQIWGMTGKGGSDNIGVIFKTNGDGSGYVVVKEFVVDGGGCFPGEHTQLIEAGGKLYGLTPLGGLKNGGVIFEYNPATGEYTKKVDISSLGGNKPIGSLVAANGKLYGVTSSGGAGDGGIVFEFDPATGTAVKKMDFPATVGYNPLGGMTLANGKLYGTVHRYEPSVLISPYNGGIYEYNPATNTMAKKTPFTQEMGSDLLTLTLAANGKLYGMTYMGGAAGTGVLFEYDPATNTYSKKHDFSSPGGKYPRGGLLASGDGKLYGMTSDGGNVARGCIFSYDPGTTGIEVEHVFNGNDGLSWGTLIEGPNGKLYGMGGGLDYYFTTATIFEYDRINNQYTVLFGLSQDAGRTPRGALTLFGGKLYGLTTNGGEYNAGVLFEYDLTTDNLEGKVNFKYAMDGAKPAGSLTQASNGKLYGVTSEGGSNNSGVVFEYDLTSETFTKHADFSFTDTGAKPQNSLTLGVNGKLYGLTADGRLDAFSATGTLFEFDPESNSLERKLSFNGTNGSSAYNTLTVSGDGKLWGLTTSGGNDGGSGTVFVYDPETNVLTSKFSFNSATSGHAPSDNITLASNGKFYSTTSFSLFEFDPVTNTHTKKHDFSSENTTALAGLAEFNGKLYGGTTNNGTVIEYNLQTGTTTKKVSFPQYLMLKRRMLLAANGKFYGMLITSLATTKPVFFEYNPVNNVLTVKKEFTGPDGESPENCALMQTHKAIRDDQTITFGPLADKTMNDGPFTVEATATSGLPVQFSASADKVTINTLNQVSLAKPGRVSIYADQPGNAAYNAASRVAQSFCVIPAKPVIELQGENTGNVVLKSSSASGNQWYFNGEPVADGIGELYSATEPGIYSVKVTIDDCVSELSDDLTLIVTGTTEVKNYGVGIFPNPAEDKLFVTLPGNQESSVNIFHMNGTNTGRYTSSAASLEINVGDYTPGIYLLRITTGKGSAITQKFIKR